MFHNNIRNLFAMFLGEEYDEKYEPFVELAEKIVGDQLIDSRSMRETQVQFLCAALANYHVQLMYCASGEGEYTAAGRMNTASQQRRLDCAKDLLTEIRSTCRSFLKPGVPLFTAFSGKEELYDRSC